MILIKYSPLDISLVLIISVLSPGFKSVGICFTSRPVISYNPMLALPSATDVMVIFNSSFAGIGQVVTLLVVPVTVFIPTVALHIALGTSLAVALEPQKGKLYISSIIL